MRVNYSLTPLLNGFVVAFLEVITRICVFLEEIVEELKILEMKLHVSGEPIVEQAGTAIVGVILGTFFAVLVVFIVIYVLYVGPLSDYR